MNDIKPNGSYVCYRSHGTNRFLTVTRKDNKAVNHQETPLLVLNYASKKNLAQLIHQFPNGFRYDQITNVSSDIMTMPSYQGQKLFSSKIIPPPYQHHSSQNSNRQQLPIFHQRENILTAIRLNKVEQCSKITR